MIASAALLASRGDAGYRQFRIPALTLTAAGTLLAVADGRLLLDDLPSPVDLVLRRSEDAGASWSPWEILRTGEGLEGFGDASLLSDPSTGTLFCFQAATTRWGFFESSPGLEQTTHVDVSVSHDDGRSWEHRRLTGALKVAGVRSLFAASGSGLALERGPHAGRLLQPMVVLLEAAAPGAAPRISSAVAISDDHGLSWRLGAPFPASANGVNGNEHSLAQLANGSLVSCSRATPHRLWSVSLDGGESFTAPVPEHALLDPSDNGSVLALRDGSALVTHNHDRFLRANTVARLRAADGGWRGAITLCAGSAGYSTAIELPDGGVGVLLERGAYEELVWVRIPREEITAALLREDGSAPLAGASAAAIEALGETLAAGWSLEDSLDVNGSALDTRVVARSITPAPPNHWVFAHEHVVLGESDAGVAPSEGKELGQAGAQIVASREDIAANMGPVEPGVRPQDWVTLSAVAHWDAAATSAITVRPCWAVDGTPAGEAAVLSPGASRAWLHLSRPLGEGELALRWEITPAPVPAT